MNLELFIAKKIHFNKDGRKKVSPPAIRIATLGVALGLAIMIISVAIVVGFKHEVSGKVIGVVIRLLFYSYGRVFLQSVLI